METDGDTQFERQQTGGDEEMEPEVPEESEDVITCSVRFPDGSSANRRFRFDDSISNLFRFVNLKVHSLIFWLLE